MVNKYEKAYKEALEIINFLPKEEYNKIPKDKIDFFKRNMDKDYNFSINPGIHLQEQNILEETYAIMIALYQDYFASEEQNTQIENILKLNELKAEQEKKKNYNPNNLFKNKTNNERQSDMSERVLVEKKDNFFSKIKNWLSNLIHKNNNKK